MFELLGNLIGFVFDMVGMAIGFVFDIIGFVFSLLGGVLSIVFSLGWLLLIFGVVIGLVKHHRRNKKKSGHIYDVDEEDFVSYYAQEQK